VVGTGIAATAPNFHLQIPVRIGHEAISLRGGRVLPDGNLVRQLGYDGQDILAAETAVANAGKVDGNRGSGMFNTPGTQRGRTAPDEFQAGRQGKVIEPTCR